MLFELIEMFVDAIEWLLIAWEDGCINTSHKRSKVGSRPSPFLISDRKSPITVFCIPFDLRKPGGQRRARLPMENSQRCTPKSTIAGPGLEKPAYVVIF